MYNVISVFCYPNWVWHSRAHFFHGPHLGVVLQGPDLDDLARVLKDSSEDDFEEEDDDDSEDGDDEMGSRVQQNW